MIEQKQFAGGGLNQDVDENFLKPNDWTNALNIRNTDRLDGSDGVISNIKGNSLVTFTLPVGTNKCIGSYANEQTKMYYSFIWNSGGLHTITEYDTTTSTVSTVLQASYLNFQQYELINGVGIIGDNLLYWTDGYNPPRGIDITKAKTGTYYTDSTSISLIKPPPQSLIIASYANDTNTTTASNRLKSQLFQFRYLYIYEDGSRSAWSSISALPLPQLELNSSVDTTPFKNNNIDLTFDIGTKYVKTIEIAALAQGNTPSGTTSDWFTILTIDRAYLTTYPGVMEFLAVGNNRTYKFFNDGLYQSVDVKEVDLPYDFVPLKSKCLDIVNGNVLVLGNNTEGYNNISGSLDTFNVQLGVSYSVPSTNPLTIADPTGLAFTFSGIPIGNGNPPPASDSLTANWTIPFLGAQTFVWNVPTYDSGSLFASIQDFGLALRNASSGIDPANCYNFDAVTGVQQLSPSSVRLNFTRVGSATGLTIGLTNATASANSTPSYKTNSKYQFGLVYYDEFNRSSYVQTNDKLSSLSGGCVIQTSSFGAVEGKVPSIAWTIKHTAPTWATKYQWVRTEQLSHKKFLFWAASSVVANPNNTNLLDLNIASLKTYNTANNDSVLAYQYSEGDRCTIHRDDIGWRSGYDVSVTNFVESTGVLTIQKATAPSALSATGNPILLEVYTPKTRSNTSTDNFFYEFAEVYSCSGGVHSVSAGTFRAGDIYNRTRVIPPAVTGTQLEDPNFSDFYVSNFSSNGRANIAAPQAKQLNLPTDIRYSDVYVPNTNINGLSRFYGDAFDTYDRVNGSIQKLAVRDNYLMTFQELKTGYIPIEQSIIEDQGGGNPNVAISTKLLNKIRYFAGDYGVGKNPESVARFAGTFYFADPNRNEILRIRDGIQSVSKIGMDSYFTAKLVATKPQTNAKILGTYDPRNNEYIVSFKYPSGENQQTIAFNEDINRWTSFYSFIPDFGGYIFNQYITYKAGAMYTHNTNSVYNSFYGTTYSSIVELVYNASPALIKSFLGLIQQGDTVWSVPVVPVVPSPVYIETNIGQTSTLLSTDFVKKEGVWFASLLRDIGSPGGLINGDDLKGNWIRLPLSNSSTSKINLLSIDVRHIPSYQGIK
jgi:hypothetical protein